MEKVHMKKSVSYVLLIIALGVTALIPIRAEDLIYVAVDPCRIVDTREAGGAIAANDFRNFLVSGTLGELAVQGGKTDCLDPKAGTGREPLAISAYILAVPATESTAGVLTAYPSDQLPPPVGTGSTVNFAAGQIMGNTTNVTLCDPAGCPTDGEFAILARSTDQHVVVDVQGYYYSQESNTPVSNRLVAVDAKGVEIGVVLGISTGGDIITLTGYYTHFAFNSGLIRQRTQPLYFTDRTCGGNGGSAWIDETSLLAGTVFRDLDNSVWYLPKPAIISDNVQVFSEFSIIPESGCKEVSITLAEAQQVLSNDPTITGIPNTTPQYLPPITIEYR